jgi:hypothetical protein
MTTDENEIEWLFPPDERTDVNGEQGQFANHF